MSEYLWLCVQLRDGEPIGGDDARRRAAGAIEAQASRITELETALLAATDIAKRQCARIEELEAERDARPVVRWIEEELRGYELTWGHLYMAHIRYHTNYGVWRCTVRDKTSAALRGDFTTPEAAKAAVEEALRGLST